MAKKDTGLKGTLSSLGPKVPIKKSVVNVEKTEEATKKIHTESTEIIGKKVRLTTDLSQEEYMKFKMKLIQQGKLRKGQEVVRGLINIYSNE